IGPLHRALHRFIFSEASESHIYSVIDPATVKRQAQRCETLQALREANHMPVVVKAFILQQRFPEEFQRIRDEYCDIFPAVKDVKVASLNDLDPAATTGDEPGFFRERLAVGVRERGVDEWITGSRLSTGMFRVLVHLWELALAPPGTVIVIDEFENSLGVNCLPALTDRLQQRSRDLQFIITSHHPYIINNIPSSFWRIVTRRGSKVTVLGADAIPGLKDVSAQDKFIRLLNVPEYEDGILSAVG
ncbi:MAG TPA: AAA family ATPase, partial [Armatimonadota bacterium]|nr:AAA family ATPase [Armatimonadota bacterium]